MKKRLLAVAVALIVVLSSTPVIYAGPGCGPPTVPPPGPARIIFDYDTDDCAEPDLGCILPVPIGEDCP